MPGTDGFSLAERILHTSELAEPLIMMLTSGEQKGDAARCRALGVAAYLIKPIRRAELNAAIVRVLSSRPDRRIGSAPVREVAPPVGTGRGIRSVAPLRILLAEDNEINRRVAVRILEKEGHQVFAVEDGRKALDALRSWTFDVVLMDVQMPVMDGLEATRAIRQSERQSSAHIPIIALTAHAMSGDRERCLEAGTDDYISKPINVRALLSLLEKHRPQPANAA
jgi:CheY-like chemotaxis protein